MINSVEMDNYRWLISHAAQPYLDRVTEHGGSMTALTQSLRRELSATRTHLVLQQVELRRRAAAKFSQSDRLFFTPQLLEQATSETVAHYKATQFPRLQPVVDFCCGIGGDSISLANRGPVTSVDCDPVALLFAEANCQLAAATQAARDRHRFMLAHAEAYRLEPNGLWHIDPDRRATGKRTTQLEQFQPSLEFLEPLRRRYPDGVMKLAPATVLPESWMAEGWREWVGTGRECREQLLWSGDLARKPGSRQATLVLADGQAYSIQGTGHEPPPALIDRPTFLAEPHAVVRAAGLQSALAQNLQLQLLDPQWSLFASQQPPPPDPLLSRFAILYSLPFNWKACKQVLRQEQYGQLEVKPRGIDLDPSSVAQRLRVPGSRQATLFVLRSARSSCLLIAERLLAEA
jgi:hypothetical protein